MFSLRADSRGYQHPFHNGFLYRYGVGESPRTLCELAMTRLSAELRSLKDWWILRQDETTKKTWFEKGLAKDWRFGSKNVKLAKHQIQYVIDELEGYAALREQNTGIQVSCFDRIWESDILFDESDLKKIGRSLDILRQRTQLSPTVPQDPDVLVDPFLYCFVRGRSLSRSPEREDFGEIEFYDFPPVFCMLPADIETPQGSATVVYNSYINNLHPSFTDIYTTLGLVLKRLLSLFEDVLTSLHRSNPLPERIVGTYKYKVWDEPEPPDDSDDEEAWTQYAHDLRDWTLKRPVDIPDIPQEGYQGQLTHILHRVKLNDRRLQVIHKIVDYTLNEHKRSLDDEDWHVEGMRHENIAACALLFLNVESIGDAHMDFRMAVTMPKHFRVNDEGATSKTWGLRNHDHCNQFIGSVPIRSGLAIAFPNFYQSRLRGVQLMDGKKQGRFTVLSFYLVDPDVPPVLSTADVAPQQPKWILRALQESLDFRFPTELVEKITSMIDSTFSEEEAVRYRSEMQRERETFRELNNRLFFSVPFDINIGQDE